MIEQADLGWGACCAAYSYAANTLGRMLRSLLICSSHTSHRQGLPDALQNVTVTVAVPPATTVKHADAVTLAVFVTLMFRFNVVESVAVAGPEAVTIAVSFAVTITDANALTPSVFVTLLLAVDVAESVAVA